MSRSARVRTRGFSVHSPTAVRPAPRGQAHSLRPGPPPPTVPERSAYPWKNQSRSGPDGRKAWSSSRLPASSVRRYRSRASWVERTTTVLRSPVPAGSSQGRLHFATAGRPSRQASEAACDALSGITVSGCGTSAAAHSLISSALSATRSGTVPGCCGSR